MQVRELCGGEYFRFPLLLDVKTFSLISESNYELLLFLSLSLVTQNKGQKFERRRMSLRHDALRRGSVVQSISKEVPWDIFDRLFLPILYCHAFAIVFSAIMQIFEIRFAFSTFGIFFIFSFATIILTLFYHNLKVSVQL